MGFRVIRGIGIWTISLGTLLVGSLIGMWTAETIKAWLQS